MTWYYFTWFASTVVSKRACFWNLSGCSRSVASSRCMDMSAFQGKPSFECQEDIYERKCFSSPFHPQIDLCLPRPCPHSPHTMQNSCWKWVCVTWPLGGLQQGLEAVKSSPLQPWTAPPLSQSQRGKDLNLEWPQLAKSPMGSSTGQSSGSPHP